jgi:uncharacterized Zn-finger protein
MDIERALKEKIIEVSSGDLPLCCPPESAPLWRLHPRVFLPIEALGDVICPYCSTRYILKDQQKIKMEEKE